MKVVAEQREIEIDVGNLTDELDLEGEWDIINLHHREGIITVKIEKDVEK